MSRILALLLIPLVCMLARCGDQTTASRASRVAEADLLRSLKSELDAKVVRMPQTVESWSTCEVAEENKQLGAASKDAYSVAMLRVINLRLEINDLQLEIQQIEGYWKTDPDVAALLKPDRRDAALRQLLIRNPDYGPYDGRDDESCRVNHVVACPQAKGPPMVAVFKAENFDEGDLRGKPIGHVILFLSTGSYVPYYRGGNVINPTGYLGDLNADGILDIADTISSASLGGDDYNELYVLPITPAQTESLQVWLRSTFDEEDNETVWDFKVDDSGGNDGARAIVIGPRTAAGEIEERARYVWSRAETRWAGPIGSTSGEFYRFDPEGDGDAQMDAFAGRQSLRPDAR